MSGRGVKRKRSRPAELEERTLPEAADEESSEPGGFLPAPAGAPRSRLQQRQLVLGLCLEKLQHYQTGVGAGLSLRRSVLLVNTLRQIQEEIQSDGAGACAPPVLGDAVRTDRCPAGEGAALTCPGCADGAGPPVSPGLPSQEQQKAPPASAGADASGDAANAVGYLSDLALDDIFEDIDTSMYESSDLPAAWVAGSLWPLSVSLWAEEDLKVCAGGLQTCLMDLNELDQIMEILVES